MTEFFNALTPFLLAGITGLLGWNWFLTKQITDLRVTIAEQYHKKLDIDAIVERMMIAVSKQIKADLAPLRFRLREISHALKLPPEIHGDDE